MSLHRMNLGKIGEDIAVEYLQKRGLSILHRNYRTRFGEIDIVAQEGNKIRFVEVKTRITITKGKPYESVTSQKKHHLRLASTSFLLQNKIKDCKLSLDVISIVLNNDSSVKELLYFEGI